MDLNISIRDILSAAVVLFAVMDVLGTVPIVLQFRERGMRVDSTKTALLVMVLLIAFLFLGQTLLGFFGVDINSFAVAGSIVLFVISMEMVLGVEIMKNDGPKDASVVPFAFPLLAGPGSFTTLLSLRAEYSSESIIVAVLLNAVFIYVVLHFSSWLQKVLGENVLYVIKKFFGIILLAMSVKLFVGGLTSLTSVMVG